MIHIKKSVAVFSFLISMLLIANNANAKCTINLQFKNNDKHKITVLGNKSQARVNGGIWSKMNFHNVTVKPGKTKSTSWTTNMSCAGNTKRDLRLKFQDSNDTQIYQKFVDNVNFEEGPKYTYALKQHK